MGEDNDPPKNPFIRWKQHVDAHIGMTLHGLLGIPTMVSKNMNLHNDTEPRSNDATGASTSNTSNSKPAASSPPNYPPSASLMPSNSNINSSSSSSSSSNNDALDGVDPNQLLEWHKFFYYSPYSPLKLQQQQQLHLLSPPVPSDVPFGADPYSFTYADAFEDLLRAESGRPLLDLSDRSFRNLHSQIRSGSAIEPPYVFFHRMHSQGLLDAYFPRTTAAIAANTLARSEALEGEAVDNRIVRAVTALAEQDPDVWRAQMAEEDADKHYDMSEDEHDEHDEHDDRYDDDFHDHKEEEERRRGGYDAWAHHDAEQRRRQQVDLNGGGLFNELDKVFRVLGRIIDEETNGDSSNAGSNKVAKRDSNSQPNSEDELYDAVRSAYSNAENSLSTLIKSFSGSGSFDSQINSQINSQRQVTRTDSQSNYWHDAKHDKELETKESTEEYTDMFGLKHVKTVVTRVDANGKEVSRETRYTVRSQTPEERAMKKADAVDGQLQQDNQDPDAPKPRKPVEKPSGWFWK